MQETQSHLLSSSDCLVLHLLSYSCGFIILSPIPSYLSYLPVVALISSDSTVP